MFLYKTKYKIEMLFPNRLRLFLLTAKYNFVHAGLCKASDDSGGRFKDKKFLVFD